MWLLAAAAALASHSPPPRLPSPCRPQIGDTLEEFLLEATPDAKLRQLMMSMSEAIRTIAYKVRGCWAGGAAAGRRLCGRGEWLDGTLHATPTVGCSALQPQPATC